MHGIMVGRCSTGSVGGWRCDFCGDDDDDVRSWVAACPSNIDGPVCEGVCLYLFLTVREKSKTRVVGPGGNDDSMSGVRADDALRRLLSHPMFVPLCHMMIS